MKNLGKIFFSTLIFFTTLLHATVTAKVEPAVVYMGESATYSIHVTGGEINKPIIDSICGNPVTATSSQTSIEMINNDYKKSYTLRYDFTPTKSCTIAPVKVVVDGKDQTSNAVNLVVKPATQNRDAEFILSLKPSKRELFVGEPFVLELTLKQSKRAEVVDSKFLEPDFKGFWVKAKSQATREETPEYIITHASYTLAPQREGNLTIQPARLKIAKRVSSSNMWDPLMPQIKWQSYFSNPVTIYAKPLPDNAKIVGNFTISAVADKTTISSNEAVNVTVTVQGDGNLEDIGSFKPYLNDVNVFAQKIEIKGNRLTQKIAFVADKDFTIPPFKLAFYNLKTKRVEQIKTKPIHIKVRGSKKVEAPLEIQTAAPTKEIEKSTSNASNGISIIWSVIAFIFGVLVTLAFMLLKPLLKARKKESKLNLKDEKLLLIKLLPYKESDADVAKIVDMLERNIYSHADEKIDKKLLKEIVKRYNL